MRTSKLAKSLAGCVEKDRYLPCLIYSLMPHVFLMELLHRKGPVRSRCVGFHDVVTVFEDDVAGSLHLCKFHQIVIASPALLAWLASVFALTMFLLASSCEFLHILVVCWYSVAWQLSMVSQPSISPVA